MKIEHLPISEIKPNDDNPRRISGERFANLVQSIKDFPEMLEIRPIVINDDNIVLGGNMRLKACIEAGIKTVPIIRAENLTEEQQKEFIIKDNVSGGTWDYDSLQNWDAEKLQQWNLEIPITVDKIEKLQDNNAIDDEFNKINDTNCELPIVPTFHEKYSYFIILTKNEIDEQFIRNNLQLNEKHTSHKSTDDRLSNVIEFGKFQELWNAR